jgi:hypothetical protein
MHDILTSRCGIGHGVRLENRTSIALGLRGFHGGTGTINEDGEIIGEAWWAKAISFYISYFPAMDVVSAFPCLELSGGGRSMKLR